MIKQDAEANFLGSLIVMPDEIAGYIDKTSEDHFGYIPHKSIWTKLKELCEAKVSVDLITFKESFSSSGLAEVGGADYLATLVANLPAKPNVAGYWTLVNEAYARRKYQSLAKELNDAAEQERPMEELHALGDKIRVSHVVNVAPTLTSMVDPASERVVSERKAGVDLKFGISGLDAVLGGMRRRLLTTYGGKTSHCKTTSIRNFILNVAESNPVAKIYYNGYENIEDFPLALAAIRSGIPLDWFVKPHLLKDSQVDQVLLAIQKLSEFKDRITISSCESVSRMRQITREVRPDIVILDYVQRAAAKHGGGDEKALRHNVAKITNDLQDIAIEFNCHVFNLSQLRRMGDERRGKEPDINDLKESGDIENYSDNIILGHWPWRDSMDDKLDLKTRYKFLIRKNKTGPCVDVNATINLDTLKISS